MTTPAADIKKLRRRLHEELAEYMARPHATKTHRDESKKLLIALFQKSRKGAVDGWPLLSGVDGGDETAKINATALKRALRDVLSPRQDHRCCYCRRWMPNNGYARNIEHVLPHTKFWQFSVHFWNLAIACAGCNLLKSDTIWGGISREKKRYPLPAQVTSWFHPRFHSYDEHVRYVRLESNGTAVVVFVGLTTAGRYLCKHLLNEVAKMELLVKSSPSLSTYESTLRSFLEQQDEAGSPYHPALRAFQSQLAHAITRRTGRQPVLDAV